MDMSKLLPLLPTMEVIQEELGLLGWACSCQISQADQVYRNVRLFTGSQRLEPDILYALRPEETDFPTDRYSYVCVTPTEGDGNHLCCPEQSATEVLDALMALFSRYQLQGSRIDQLAYRSASLDELCQLSEELLGNPVYIHDDWFILIGMSPSASQVIAPEYLMSSSVGFIPRVILEDFKYDSEYLDTYAHHRAQIWISGDDTPNTLYVNLLDGAIYRGRFLVAQSNRSFRKSDYILAEVLTQRAILMLQKKLLEDKPQYRSMDDTVLALLEGHPANPSDLTYMLGMLQWDRGDRFLCIRIKSQKNERNTVMEHQLHSDLFRLFPGSYILFMGQEQCLILNLEHSKLYPIQLRHRLAPLCRDYYLYAGISSPVDSVSEWFHAYYQAGVALNQAFRMRSDRWVVPFSECVLEHTIKNLPAPLAPGQLVSPDLNVLIRYDQENGTQYFQTLREYLLNERDIPKTSEKLIVHRTTLLYRLKKIQSLVSLNLEDPWQRLYLMLSLWILSNGEGLR